MDKTAEDLAWRVKMKKWEPKDVIALVVIIIAGILLGLVSTTRWAGL